MPHGNICPDNIFITFDGRILMIDSGFADLVRFRYDGVSIIPNTFSIFSHEDIKKGKRWKKRYEIYSLGLLLLCMLIGYNHFMGFYNQDDTHKLESPSRFFPSIPSDLNRIIVRCIGNKTFGRNARYVMFRSL
jgi:serine/threonine protein kinase